MKKTMRCVVLSALWTTGCTPALYGEGGVRDATRDLAGFSALETDGVNVKVQIGADWQVTVRTDTSLQSAVQTTLDGDTLRIAMAEGAQYFPTTLEVLLTLPALEDAVQYGTADLLVEGLDAEMLSISANGSGHTELEGAVTALLLESSGAGVRNAQDLEAAEVEVITASSGAVWVRASEAISGSLSGPGDLNIFGDPKHRDVVVQGAGEVVYY